jgi:hypothetical protein
MAWECSDCGRKEERGGKITVCHHCGRPVCDQDRVMASDGAFDDSPGHRVTNVAVHCRDCWSAFHSRGATAEPGALGVGGWATA